MSVPKNIKQAMLKIEDNKKSESCPDPNLHEDKMRKVIIKALEWVIFEMTNFLRVSIFDFLKRDTIQSIFIGWQVSFSLPLRALEVVASSNKLEVTTDLFFCISRIYETFLECFLVRKGLRKKNKLGKSMVFCQTPIKSLKIFPISEQAELKF